MNDSTTNTISEVDKENPLHPLQLQNIANAKTEEELKTAVEQTISGLHRFYKTNSLQEYQAAVKEFLNDPMSAENAKKMAETAQKCANAISVRNGNKLKDSISELDRRVWYKTRFVLSQQHKISSACRKPKPDKCF